MSRLDGMVAVVTGAGPGIGRASAIALGRAGASVVVAARDVERLTGLAAEVSAETGSGSHVLPLRVDLADATSCRSLVEQVAAHFGRIDVLVNVATTGGDFTRIEDTDWDSWRQAFEVNVIGTLEVSRAAAGVMAQGGGGSIIQIGTFGTHALPSGRARYIATKQAMVTASLTMAKELGRSNVRVNVVTPGFITGPSLDAMIESTAARTGESAHEASQRLAASSALGRHVEPADVAETVLFLAGPGARTITGVELPVTAGR